VAAAASANKPVVSRYAVGRMIARPHASPRPGRLFMGRLWGLVALVGLTGCAGELTVLAALAFGTTLGAWMIGAGRQRRALYEAESLRRAIAAGEHRGLEERLRKELMLAEAGEAVSPERQWLARAQLGGLMVAEWRLDEAREIYGTTEDGATLAPHLQALASFGRHELAVLTETPDEARLAAIRRDRDLCLQHVPSVFRHDVELAWNSVEGLCLVRMGRAREAVDLLAGGLKALEYNPALVVYLFHLGQAYEHIGERKLAAARYEEAAKSFPGTRLASEAQFRLRALQPGGGDGSMFRAMLPEAPAPTRSTALARVSAEDDDGEAKT
jgi:tetratricopeptide (TPR) repeat protein